METDNANQQVPPQAPLPNPPNHSKIFIIVLGIVFVLMLGIGGYVLGKSRKQTHLQSQPTTPSPTTNDTANWKTFTDTTYGFTFSYPSEYFKNNLPRGSPLPTMPETYPLTVHFSNKDFPLTRGDISYINDINLLTVSILGGYESLSLDAYVDSQRLKETKIPTTIDGEEAYKFYQDILDSDPIFNKLNYGVVIKKGKYLYWLTLYSERPSPSIDYKDQFDDILNTFKFTDRDQN